MCGWIKGAVPQNWKKYIVLGMLNMKGSNKGLKTSVIRLT